MTIHDFISRIWTSAHEGDRIIQLVQDRDRILIITEERIWLVKDDPYNKDSFIVYLQGHH